MQINNKEKRTYLSNGGQQRSFLWTNQVDAAAGEILIRRDDGGAPSSGVNGVLEAQAADEGRRGEKKEE